MNASQPVLGHIARSLRIYKPLHRWWIGHLVRQLGFSLTRSPGGVFELSAGDRVIRYANWSMAYFLATSFDYYFDAVESVNHNGRRLVDYSRPSWHRLRCSGELFLFNDLAEPESTTLAYLDHAQLQSGHVAFDLGAYNGTQTVLFSRAVGTQGRVYAFEPDSVNRAALVINLDHHSASNVQVIPAGIWSRSGQLMFSSDGTMGSSLIVEHEHDGDRICVPVVSLDDFAAEHDLSRLDFVKMDIEGAELEGLAGAASILQRFRPRLAVETHVIDGKSLLHDAEAFLTAMGYRCHLAQQAGCDLPLLLASF